MLDDDDEFRPCESKAMAGDEPGEDITLSKKAKKAHVAKQAQKNQAGEAKVGSWLFG